MAQYSIRELEELSGIKAHTIRIWEKRYGIVSPLRTATNIRLYSDADLKKIINVSLLNNHGVRISKIANLTPSELVNQVTQISETQTTPAIHIDRLVVAMVDLDEERFEAILNELIGRFGFEKSVLEIVYPFLDKIGVLWLTGHITPIQEHFISNLLRQKMLVAIDRLPIAGQRAKKIILFLPDGELHELGLLFSYYVAKKAGFRAYYMGQSTPFEDIDWFCKTQSPVAMITSITTSPAPHLVEPFLLKLCTTHPGVLVLAAGHHLSKMALRIPENLHLLRDARHLKALLGELDMPKPHNFR